MHAPNGVYFGEFHIGDRTRGNRYKASGEFRPPRKGEHYLSGAIITAYRAPNDLDSPYWIAVEHTPVACPTCGHIA